MRAISVEEIQEIHVLHKKGLSEDKIAKKTDRSLRCISHYIRGINCLLNGKDVPETTGFSKDTLLKWWETEYKKNNEQEEQKSERRVKYKVEVTVWEYL